MSLDHTKDNQIVKVNQILGGWNVRQRLNQLGVNVGDTLIVKRTGTMGGPILIKIHNLEVAIGRGMANKIIVEPLLM